MQVQGVTSFCAGEALSQPSCLPVNSWKILLTAFIMSVSPSSNPSPLWRCCSSRNCAICTWGCWGSVSVSHGRSWSDYPGSPGKGRDLSWGGSKLSFSPGSCFTPGFLRVFHRKPGVRMNKVDGKHRGKWVCQPHSGKCLHSIYKRCWPSYFLWLSQFQFSALVQSKKHQD